MNGHILVVVDVVVDVLFDEVLVVDVLDDAVVVVVDVDVLFDEVLVVDILDDAVVVVDDVVEMIVVMVDVVLVLMAK